MYPQTYCLIVCTNKYEDTVNDESYVGVKFRGFRRFSTNRKSFPY